MSPLPTVTTLLTILISSPSISAFSVVTPSHDKACVTNDAQCLLRTATTSLNMIDTAVIEGAGIAASGVAAGISVLMFTEGQGEKAKARGSGLSDDMATRMAGGFMEDVEMDTVSDMGGLTDQLEMALE